MPRLGRSRPASAYQFIGRTPAGIKWRVGSGASADSGGGTAASQAITIPSTVQAGDVCLVAVEAAINTAYSLSVSSTGTTPAQLGTDATYTVGGYITILRLYWFAAAGTLGNISTDAGKVITFTPTVSAYLGASIGAWWGCSASQPDVISSPATLTTANTSFTAPSATTGSPGDWAVYIAGIGGASSVGFAAPGTFRTGGTNARTNIADSNGSVGAPGTVIGGVTWQNAGSAATWAGFTVGLQPTGSGSSTVSGAATITGQGSLSTAATEAAGATIAGAGSLGTPDVTQQQDAGATLAGGGSLGTPDVTVQAPATLAGAGTLTTAATEQAPSALTGAGAVGTPDSSDSSNGTLTGQGALTQPDSILQAPATITGQGQVSANTSPTGAGSIAGQGSLTAPAVQGAGMSLAGQGQLATTDSQGAGSTLTGAGALGAPDSASSAGTSLTGAGQLSGTGTSGGGQGATLAGQGQFAAAAVILAIATMTGHGQITAAATVITPASLPVLGYAAAAPAGPGQDAYATAGTWP